MNSPAKAHEPTMEEILASIRRIISDDEKDKPVPPKPQAAAKPEPAIAAKTEAVGQDDIDALFAEADKAEPVGQDDIDALFASPEKPETVGQDDIDALFAEATAAQQAKTTPSDLENDLDVLELTEEMEEPARTPAKPSPPPLRPAPALERPIASSEQDLLSAAVGAQVSNAFGTLAHTVLAGSARTLDDIVREMLRPMLKAWLDDNLPPLVERLVRQEIERVARGGR